MELSSNMSAITQRDQALSILDSNIPLLSELYEECCLSMGRGALLVYARNIIERGLPKKYDYRTKEEILDIFEAPSSRTQLEKMINNYDQERDIKRKIEESKS